MLVIILLTLFLFPHDLQSSFLSLLVSSSRLNGRLRKFMCALFMMIFVCLGLSVVVVLERLFGKCARALLDLIIHPCGSFANTGLP